MGNGEAILLQLIKWMQKEKLESSKTGFRLFTFNARNRPTSGTCRPVSFQQPVYILDGATAYSYLFAMKNDSLC